jgi:hypothetical protein
MERILHGAERGLGVVAAMQVVAHTHFQNHTLGGHGVAALMLREPAPYPARANSTTRLALPRQV